jgi:hypothetical protein
MENTNPRIKNAIKKGASKTKRKPKPSKSP